MIKTFYLSLLGLIAPIMGNAQTVLFSEDFDGNIPAGWQVFDNTGGGSWQYSYYGTGDGYRLASDSRENGFALFDSDAQGNDAQAEETDLISPSINCSSSSTVYLTFFHYFRQFIFSEGIVSVSNDGGTSWTDVKTFAASTPNGKLEAINISSIAGSQPNVRIRFRYTGDWDYYWLIDDVQLVVPLPNDATAKAILLDEAIPLGERPLKYRIQNTGSSILNNVDVSYTIDGDTKTETIDFLNLGPFQSVERTHNDLMVLPTEGNYTISLSTANPNGNPDDNTTNDATAKVVYAMATLPDHHLLLEYFASADSGITPQANLSAQALLAASNNSTIVAIHDDDIMQMAGGVALKDSLQGLYHQGMLNRSIPNGEAHPLIDTALWLGKATNIQNQYTFAGLTTSNTYNSTTRELSVVVNCKFYAPLAGDYRINCYVVEDSVSGGIPYDQANVYSSNGTYPWHPLFSSPTTITNYQHPAVARALLGGPWGTTGIIPSNPIVGESYNHTYAATLPAGWNTSNCRLIVVLQQHSPSQYNRPIINSVTAQFNSSAAVNTTEITYENNGPQLTNATLQLYPNPSQGQFYLNCSEIVEEIAVYSLNGSLIHQQLVEANKALIQLKDVAAGQYFLSAKLHTGLTSRLPLIVIK